MSDVVSKKDLFTGLGYGGEYELLEQALEDAGLSRAGKPNIDSAKSERVRDLLAGLFVPICSRGDCQAAADEVADGRTPVPASAQDACAVCGGSANARAVDAMVDALRAAGMTRLCVVGGSPNLRVELERLIGGRLDVRMVDGTVARSIRQAAADARWAHRVALWGGTMLDHKVSNLYRGVHVIQFARRSIAELAREVARSVG